MRDLEEAFTNLVKTLRCPINWISIEPPYQNKHWHDCMLVCGWSKKPRIGYDGRFGFAECIAKVWVLKELIGDIPFENDCGCWEVSSK